MKKLLRLMFVVGLSQQCIQSSDSGCDDEIHQFASEMSEEDFNRWLQSQNKSQQQEPIEQNWVNVPVATAVFQNDENDDNDLVAAPICEINQVDVIQGQDDNLNGDEMSDEEFAQWLQAEELQNQQSQQSQHEQLQDKQLIKPTMQCIKDLSNDIKSDDKECLNLFRIQYVLDVFPELLDEIRSEYGLTEMTPLMSAVFNGKPKVVKLLIRLRAKLDVQDKYGATALHVAVRQKDSDIAKMLIENDANVHIENNKGQSPLDLMKSLKKFSLLKLVNDMSAQSSDSASAI